MPVANPITKREGARKQTTREENQTRAQQIMAGFHWRAGASDTSNSCLTHPLNPGPWFAETYNLVWSRLVVYIFFHTKYFLVFCTKIQHGHTVALYDSIKCSSGKSQPANSQLTVQQNYVYISILALTPDICHDSLQIQYLLSDLIQTRQHVVTNTIIFTGVRQSKIYHVFLGRWWNLKLTKFF